MTSLYNNSAYNLPRISLYNNPSQDIPYPSIPQYYEFNKQIPMNEWNKIQGTYLPSFTDFQTYAVDVYDGLNHTHNQGILQKGGKKSKKKKKKNKSKKRNIIAK